MLATTSWVRIGIVKHTTTIIAILLALTAIHAPGCADGDSPWADEDGAGDSDFGR